MAETTRGDFEAWLDEQRAQEPRHAALQAPAVTPEQMAHADRIARQRGLPRLAVADDLQSHADLEELDRISALSQQDPKLGAWLADPGNVAAARDDLDNLSAIGRAAGSNQRRTWFGTVLGNLIPGGGEFGDQQSERFGAATVGMVANTAEQGAEYLERVTASANRPMREIMKLALRDAQLRADREEADAIRAQLAATEDPMGIARFRAQQAGVSAAVRDRQSELQALNERPTSALDALRRPGNALRYYGGLLTDSLPAILATMATRRPVAGSALMGQTAGAAEYSRRRAEGRGVLESTQLGAAQAGVEAAFSLPVLGEAFTAGARRMLTVPAMEAGTEGATEVVQTEVSDVLTGERTSREDKWAQAIDAMLVGGPAGVVEAVLGGNGEIPPATLKRSIDVARARADRGYLDGLVKAAAASKLRKSSPAMFEDYLQGQVGDATVYLPVAQAQALFQSASLDPTDASIALTGDANAWAEAEAAGTDLAVPLSRYLTHLAEAHEAIGTAVRLSPGGADVAPDAEMPTREEILADIERYQAELAAGREPEARAEGVLGEIYDDVYGQLLGSGADEATIAQQASVVQALFRSLSERTGLNPAVLRDRFVFNINRPQTAQGPRARGLDIGIDPLVEAALSGRTFSDREIFGGSLVEAVIAEGGVRPTSVGGGDLLAADAQHRSGLTSMTGRTVEDMAQRLVDNGWGPVFTTTDWAGRPDYRELVDLIRQELSGQPVRMPAGEGENGDRALQRREFRANVEAIREAFAAHGRATGVDPATLSREEQRAIAERVFAEQPGALDQAPLYQDAIPADDEVARLRQQLAALEAALGEERRLRRESPVTGLRNRLAFDEDAEAGLPFVGSADMDGLKRINDTHGHPVGDAMLGSIGAVMLAVQAAHTGVRLYHASGDEFLARAASQEEADAALAEVRDRLESVVVEVEVAEGDATVRYEYHGIGLSYGLGASLEQAEQGLRADKQSRLQAGIREDARADAGGALGPSRRAVRRPAGQGAVGEGPQPDAVTGALFQSNQPFHSALLRSVEEAKGAPKRADAAAWKGWLDGAQRRGEFRLEEREWLGIDEWLSGQSSVTREQLQEFVRASQLQVEETTMGPPPTPATADAAPAFDPAVLDDLPFVVREIHNTAGTSSPGWGVYRDSNLFSAYGSQEEAERAAYDFSSGSLRAGQGIRLPRLRGLVVARVTAENAQGVGIPGQWALFDVRPGTDEEPGELLAPVEVDDSASYARAMHSAVQDAAEMDAANGSTIVEEYGSVAAVGAAPSTPAPYASMTLPGGGNYRVLLLKMPDVGTTFTGGHFEQNTVAHVRFDERVDADGNRVLFINELQSDWHQKGRSRGYIDASGGLPDGWVAYQNEHGNWNVAASADGAVPTLQADGALAFAPETREEAIESFLRVTKGQAVPDAPFKTTWPELVMKRMVRWAAEHGFDRVAWPTVDMVPQIEGWGMSLEEIRASPELSKRFGAILARYETDLPRIAKALGKKFGARVVESRLETGARDGAVPPPSFEHLPVADSPEFEDLPTRSFDDGDPLISRTQVLVDGKLSGVSFMLARDGVSVISDGAFDTVSIDWSMLGFDNPADVAQASRQFAEAWATGRDVESAGNGLWDALDDALDETVAPLPPSSATVPALEITTELREAALAGLPLFQTPQGGERGSVVIGNRDAQGRRVFDISLFAGADRSTFLHEAGHAFAEILGDLAADPEAPAQIVEDFHAMLRFMEAPGATDAERAAWWRSQPVAARRDGHERWARGFEAYLMEGKAPSPAMRRAFAHFKVWLTNLYRSLRGLNIELTDEVRGVFDRMLATDAEIAEARQGLYHEALITDALAVGMDEVAFAAYSRAVDDARADAEAVLAAEVLRDRERAQRAFLGAERRKIRAEVEAQTRQLPVYRALRWLRRGQMPDGSPAPESLKLSKEALLDQFGQTFLQHLRGTYSVEGGVSPNEAAAVLGYPDGATLIDALVNAPPLAEVVAADTDRILAERYPDPMLDGSLVERAMAAVHGAKQGEAMLLEVQALERHTEGRVRSQAAVLREVARRMIAEKQARRVQPGTYRSAEAKAGKEAFEAASRQDWPAALAARRRQLLNHLLAAEASRARTEVESAQKYLRRFTKTKRRAALGKAGADYLEQIDGLLERFDLRGVSGAASDRRARLRDWIARKAEEGVTVDLPASVLDEALSIPFRDLTVEQVRDLRSAVKHLAHLADLKNSLLLNGQRRDRAEVDAELAESIASAHGSRPVGRGDPRRGDRARESAMQARALTAGATDLARELDGFTEQGAVWRHTVGVIREAMNRQVRPRLEKAAEDLANLWLKHYATGELRTLDTAVVIPGMPAGERWSKARILSLALNWGNAGNREAILTQARGRLSQEEVGILFGTLTARDWQMVQDAWALVDSFWPDIARAQKQRTGLVPEKVPADPFTVVTADGQTLQIAGGYYPLKYAGDEIRSKGEQVDDFYKAIVAGTSAKAATRNGHTIERVGSGGRTVRLDLGVLDQHLRDMIRDVWLGDAVNYVDQVMRGPAFADAVNDARMVDHVQALKVWLKDAAAGEMGLRIDAIQWHRTLRTNLTASVLTYKVVSAALQISGFIQTSVVLGKRATLAGIRRYSVNPREAGRYVDDASPFMRARGLSTVEAVQEVMSARSGWLRATRQTMLRYGYWMIGRVQRIVDVASWLGAEAKGMRLFNGDVEKARAYADDLIARAQASQEFIDKNAIQRGTLGEGVRQSEIVASTTSLMSYMIAKTNIAYERTRTTDFRRVDQAAGWALDMVSLYTLEALIVAAIRSGFPDDEDDDGGVLDDWAKLAATETLGSIAGGIPVLSQFATELRGYDAKSILGRGAQALGRAFEQARQGELDKAAVKSVVNLAGMLYGAPSAQINKTIDAIQARRDGADVDWHEYIRGLDKD